MSGKTGRAAPLPPEERRAAIIAATIPLVREHGFAVNTRQIAEAAGVAEGTLFRVFPTKQALVEEAVAHAIDPRRGVRALDAIDRAAPLPERLAAAVETVRQGIQSTWQLFAVLRATQPAGSQEPRPTVPRREAIDLLAGSLTRLLEPDADRFGVSPGKATRLLMSLIFAAGRMPDDAPGEELTTEDVVDLFLYGVLSRDRSSADRSTSC